MQHLRILLMVVVGMTTLATATSAAEDRHISCEGTWPHHLQGVCIGPDSSIYWSFTTVLIRTDSNGRLLKSVEVADHHGDACYHQGRVWVAVNLGEFNQPAGKADSWVYGYDPQTLECVSKHPVADVVHGAGGIAAKGDRFLVVGGLPDSANVNYVYEYDPAFRLVQRHVLASGHTHLGIQTAAFAQDHWWFGCYGSPQVLLKASADLQQVERFEFNCSLGIVATDTGFLVARGSRPTGKGHTGELLPAQSDAAAGLRLVPAESPQYDVEIQTVLKGYDGKSCWVHPRAGIIPGEQPQAVMTMLRLDVSGSDLFSPTWDLYSLDRGVTWSKPKEHSDTLGQRSEPGNVVYGICDFTPQWHEATGKLLAIGQTVRYRNNAVIKDRARETAWSVYDPDSRTWSSWQTLDLPDEARYYSCGAGSVQRVDLADGTIMLPVYYAAKGESDYRVSVLKCSFDGSQLRYLDVGNELKVEGNRGFAEPSLARFGDRWYLTLRNNAAGYVTSGTDGLHFDEPQIWTFDDGTELGNYNTQQHWITHPRGLFLVYTRKGVNNDHVFRHRAPLLIAQVDPERMCVIRSTEQILVPERGARLGNFGVTHVSPTETWVTVAEWMQSWSPNVVMPVDNPWGADNSVYIARISWHVN